MIAMEGSGSDVSMLDRASGELIGLHRQMGRILDQEFPPTSHLASPPAKPTEAHVPAMRRVHEPFRFNNRDVALAGWRDMDGSVAGGYSS